MQCCKSEAPRHIKDVHIPEGWPKSGSITFQSYKMRYRENTPIVLNGLNFLIHAGEKLGIVGRTGSGKILSPVFDTHYFNFRQIVFSENGQFRKCIVYSFDML